MKNQLFILIFLITASLYSSAQQITFQKTYGGTSLYDTDNGASVQQTTDGGYIIAGYTHNFGAGDSDVYLIKTNPIGDSLWTRTYGGTISDYGYSVQQTTDGGYVIAGVTSSFGAGNNDVYLIKTDTDGDIVWTKTFGGTDDDEGYSVQQTTDGGYIITGVTYSFGAGDADVYLIKTDSNGDTLWTKTYGGIVDDKGYSVKQTTDGGYVITGSIHSFGTFNDLDVYLIKTDPNGNSLWTKNLGGPSVDAGFSIQQTTDGGYIIAGWTGSFGAFSNNIYLVKTDTIGNPLWSKAYGAGVLNYSNSVQQTTDSGYVIAGITQDIMSGFWYVYLIKTNVSGDTLWTKILGNQYGDFVQQTTDGGYIVVGQYSALGIGSHVYAIKTDSIGNSGCNGGNPSTIMATGATQAGDPSTTTIVTSPATIVTAPTTIIGSGGIVNTLCTTVGINETLVTSNSIAIFPNPFTSEISITLTKQDIKQAAITIKNILGQTVFEKTNFKIPPDIYRDQTTLDLSFLLKGIYLLEVNIDEERTVKKIVKE